MKFSDLYNQYINGKLSENNYKFLPKNENLLKINESSLSRIYKKYQDCDSGTISAFRSEFSYDENMKRTRNLKNLLLQKGYSVTKIIGNFIENIESSDEKEVKEVSFIVFDRNKSNNLRNDLFDFGDKFNQDSITFAKANSEYYLIGINGYPGRNKSEKLGKPTFSPNEKFIFSSSIKGRKFVFKVDESFQNIDDHILRYSHFSKLSIIKECENFLNETNLGRVWKNVEENCMICISALRDEITDLKTRQNLTKELEIKIKKGNFGFSKVKGGFIETLDDGTKVSVEEDTFMVFFKSERLKEALVYFDALRQKFKQESFLLVENKIAYYIDNFGKHEIGKFNVNTASQYFTKLKNGKSFTFESESIITDMSGRSGLLPTSRRYSEILFNEFKTGKISEKQFIKSVIN